MSQLLEIDSKPYGKVQVSEDQKIVFEDGIYGFETLKEYYLLDFEQEPFYWLQSVDVKEVAFVIINPQNFKSDYKLVINDSEYKELGFRDEEDINKNLLHFCIVTIPQDDPKKMTANLLGPIIINKKSKRAKQALSLVEQYKVKHYILEELEKSGEGGN